MTNPTDQRVAALYATGLEHHRAGRLPEARAAYDAVLSDNPGYGAAWHKRGVVSCQIGRIGEGTGYFRKAVEVSPNDVLSWMDLGAALRELSDLPGAVACFERVIQIDPRHAEAHNSRGEALSAQMRHEKALASYEHAIRINPGDAKAQNNAGGALLEMGQYVAALECFRRAREMQAGYVKAIANSGSALHALGRYAEALVEYDRTLALDSGYTEARSNRGMTRLLLGDLRNGWPDYEARLPALGAPTARSFAQPRWYGAESVAGKTVLVYAEQGLGDTLQFCRYARLVADRGAKVILETPAGLVSLLACLKGVEQVIAQGDALPRFDLQVPLLSLPLAFGTDLPSVPSEYAYLRADPCRVRAWEARLGAGSGRPRVGLAWSGAAGHRNDRNRSLALDRLLQAVNGVDAEFISLQKDLHPGDRTVLAGSDTIRHFGEDLLDFSETAALTALMDIVISVDTSIAHLAAAMGRPTWILLPRVPDWRWLLEREDSPWYPTARLFRQRELADWTRPLSALRSALEAHIRA